MFTPTTHPPHHLAGVVASSSFEEGTGYDVACSCGGQWRVVSIGEPTYCPRCKTLYEPDDLGDMAEHAI